MTATKYDYACPACCAVVQSDATTALAQRVHPVCTLCGVKGRISEQLALRRFAGAAMAHAYRLTQFARDLRRWLPFFKAVKYGLADTLSGLIRDGFHQPDIALDRCTDSHPGVSGADHRPNVHA